MGYKIMKYFIADTHFCHKDIIGFSRRPFDNIEDMNKQLISNWNKTVKSDDDIYILGDFLFMESGRWATKILNQLNGKKYLIKGNHEEYLNDTNFDDSQFEWIKDYYSFEFDNRKFVLFHYPIMEWDGYYERAIHLYGHVHNMKTDYFKNILGINAMNVGVDMIGYRPISIEQVLCIINEREMSC